MKPVLRRNRDSPSPGFKNPLVDSIVDSVRSMMCASIPDDPSPTGRLNRALQKTLFDCPPDPPDPDNEQNWSDPSALCYGIRYNVLVQWKAEDANIVGEWVPVSGSAGDPSGGGVFGPITNLRTKKVNGNLTVVGDHYDDEQAQIPVVNQTFFAIQDNAPGVRRNLEVSVRCVRSAGNPPGCPNGTLPVYPPAPPRNSPNSPAPRQFPDTILVPIGDGVTVPFGVDVRIAPNGSVTVRVNDSIDIEFNDNSTNIYINPDSGFDVFPDAPVPDFNAPPGFPSDPTGNAGESGCDDSCPSPGVQDIIDELESIRECVCSDEQGTSLVPGQIITANNGTVPLPANAHSVKLELVSKPPNPKSEWGGGNAPNVYYAGWTSFMDATGQLERTPIDYETKSFPVPSGAESFTFTGRQKYLCRVTVILKLRAGQ